MASKSVFISKTTYPFFEEIKVNIDWFGGFALSQKRKCEISLHENFLATYPQFKILEVSSASLNSLGVQLSAMNLSKETSLGITTVESAFQSSRIYTNPETGEKIGPFPEYLLVDGKTSKKMVKEQSCGFHSYHYLFENLLWGCPTFHISLFYDYLYLTALMENGNEAIRNKLIAEKYDAFTDLATNSLNCQARSAAIFVGLYRAGLTEYLSTPESFKSLFRVSGLSDAIDKSSYENVQLLGKKGIQLLSPKVSKSVDGDEVQKIYSKYYGHLTNKKSDP